ncbi:response regulator [Halobacteriovorax sp. GB3]|uniref:response regulator n=1 Tax=Halobacteriovorax sp. GB3 TaxID=2719615 RepID=UPI00235EF2D5|nr:response regulator [Halobacteriovorax sp. GB3]MDD0854638.1 response regulator [Halobacteriovorax sp. GB3]
MKKILLIEDEPLIQKSLKKLLEKKGADVSIESSGKMAIEQIINKDFDRIICDLMLQDITGFDVIEESKKKFSKEEISEKFIIITAYTSEQTLNKAEYYGCRLLGKPFENINEALKTFLGEN